MNKCVNIFVFLLLLCSISCDDYLDRGPLTQIENDAYWNTDSDLENYTLQFYPSLPSYGNVGSYLGLIGWDGTRGSDTQISAIASTTWDGTRSVITSGGNWSWKNIRSVNIFFDNYLKCKELSQKAEQAIGEAYFFRAWFYFEKVKAYGDVPWYSHALSMDSQDLYKSRDSRVQIVDSILKDLDEAIRYLKFIKDLKEGNNRLSKEAALLFKSRVALYEGSWQKYHKGTEFGSPNVDPNKYFRIAVDASEELMSSEYNTGIYSNNVPQNDYCKLFSLKDHTGNKEVILWKRYDKLLGMGHSFQIYVSDRTAGISVTLQQILHYLKKDGTPYDYFSIAKSYTGNDFLTKVAEDCDPRLSQTVWIPGSVMWDNDYGYSTFVKPFLDQSGEYLNNTGFQLKKGNDPKDPQAGSGVSWNTNCETGAIIFRYAEALLNYAEAKCELGEPVDYDKSINLLRKRVGMPDFKIQNDKNRSFYADYGYEISDELNEIRRERTVELACEGFRYDDIMRWRAHSLLKGKRPKGYPIKLSEWSNTINYKTDENGFLDPYVDQIPNGYGFNPERDYLECLPINELTLNPNLNQNPNW